MFLPAECFGDFRLLRKIDRILDYWKHGDIVSQLPCSGLRFLNKKMQNHISED